MRHDDPLKPGRRFHHFTVVRLLGRGGMGRVYEVIGRGGRRYALKVLEPSWVDRDAQVQRMLDEGVVMVGIKHANIVEVHDHGVHEGRVWMLMELLEGESLRACLLREGPLSLKRTCSILRSASYAAEQCHLLGIIHRDIKPENFMITPDQRVKMLDLGIAHIHRSTVTQDPIGTPAYMAPEQFNTRLGVSPATDVYALGLMGFEMLAGFHPFLRDEAGRERNAWELCYEHSFTGVPALMELGVPGPIAEVVSRASSKDPRRRYASGGLLADAIWAGWKQVRKRVDAEEGDALLSATEEVRFGTGPVQRLTAAAKAPITRAVSERLPPGMDDPAVVQAYLNRRATEDTQTPKTAEAAVAATMAEAAPHPRGGTMRIPLNAPVHPRGGTLRMADRPVHPRGGTVRMPASERDPGCAAADIGPPASTAPLAWGTQPTPTPQSTTPAAGAAAPATRTAAELASPGAPASAPTTAARPRPALGWLGAALLPAALVGATLALELAVDLHDKAEAPQAGSDAPGVAAAMGTVPTDEPTAVPTAAIEATTAAAPIPAPPSRSAPAPRPRARSRDAVLAPAPKPSPPPLVRRPPRRSPSPTRPTRPF